MQQLIECVPNFSEGNNINIINTIADEIKSVNGVKLLNVDPGKSANRTVYTFVGNPQSVIEAAFRAIKKASELIDMRMQKGEHPRIGATDVCPLIPISGITLEETSHYAKQLGERVGKELNIPVFLYEASQTNKNRSNLAVVRKGEYEGMFKKIKLPEWKPDYGPSENSIKSGATVIGARNFLIAYNINLNTTSVELANLIACQVRESGYTARNSDGDIKIKGSLKSVKAIGWYIKEYGFAQVSMNITDIHVTPVHVAFEEVCKKAKENGVEVTGSELIGLIPLQAMLSAGKYFLEKQNGNGIVSDKIIIDAAVKSLGLNQLSTFDPQKRIIELMI